MKTIFARWLTGSNYWQRNSGIDTWRVWSPDLIRQELAQARELGCRIIRIPLRWSDFQPSPYKVDSEMLGRFDELISIAHELRLQLIPTFFVDPLSSGFDQSWRPGREYFQDTAVIKAQEHLIRTFAERYAKEHAILIWDLGTTSDDFGPPMPAAAVGTWAAKLRRVFTEAGCAQPIAMGTSAINLADSAPAIKATADALDFLLVSTRAESSISSCEGSRSLRQTYWPGFSIHLTRALCHRPVLLSEFGISSLSTAPGLGADYYRICLASAFANDAAGALSWCLNDYSCLTEEPFDSVPVDAGYGMLDLQANTKDCAKVFKTFMGIANRIDLGKLEIPAYEAAIVIPRCLCSEKEDWMGGSSDDILECLLTSFIMAKQAGLQITFITPDEDFRDYRFLIMPYLPETGGLRWSDWQHVADFVEYGGTVFASYGGVAFNGMDDLFGFTRISELPRRIGAERILPTSGLRQAQDFSLNSGGLPALLVENEFATLARDDDGRPFITYSTQGDGHVIFCRTGLETAIAAEPGGLQTKRAYSFYEHAASLAGLGKPFVDSHPDIEYRSYTYGGRRLLLLVNHGEDERLLRLKPEYSGLRPITQEDAHSGSDITIRAFAYQWLVEK